MPATPVPEYTTPSSSLFFTLQGLPHGEQELTQTQTHASTHEHAYTQTQINK